MIRAAIVGFGLSGRVFHLPLLRASGFSVKAAVVNRPDRHVGVDGIEFSSMEAVCSDKSIDLLVICSPNALHLEHGLKAIGAGKHVVIEKPLATNAHDAASLVQASNASDAITTVFHSRRWDGDFLTLKRLLREGAVGDWRIFESRWSMNKPIAQHRWKDSDDKGGGLLMDFIPHLVDQALCLFGPPECAFADIATQRAGAVGADYVAVTMHYGPKRVVLSADCFSANPGWRFRLAGTNAEYVCSGFDKQETQLRGSVSPAAPEFGVGSADRISRLVSMSGDSESIELDRGNYRGFYDQLKLAIAGGLSAPVQMQDAEIVVMIIDALRTKGRWRRG